MWDRAGGHPADPDELAEQIIREAPANTEGITLSGGEPMAQGVSVYAFMCSIRARRPDWSIGMYSGYTGFELAYGQFDLYYDAHPQPMGESIKTALWIHQIRRHLDWAVLGRFDRTRMDVPADRPDARLVSSANQHLSLLSGRYTYDDFRRGLLVEISLGATGTNTVTGFPVRN